MTVDSNFLIAHFFAMAGLIAAWWRGEVDSIRENSVRAATYVESVDLPAVEELSERLLRAIDYYGLVEIEYKLDQRDGLYKLLDINARAWGFHSLGAPAGVDFPYLLFADQMGESTEQCRGKAGIGWLRMITDVPTVLFEMLRGQLDFSSYIRSLRHTQVESVFSV